MLESFTSFINNQNDFEIIEEVEAINPSILMLEIATIKDMLHESGFIAQADGTPLLLQLYIDVLLEIHMKLVNINCMIAISLKIILKIDSLTQFTIFLF